MKRLALLLALILLPCAARADRAVDVGLGVITVPDGALVQLGEKTDEGGTLAVIVPDRRMGRPFYDGITVAWSPDRLIAPDTDAEALTRALLETSVADMAALDVAVLGCEAGPIELDAAGGTAFLRYALEADCSGLGYARPLTLYYARRVLCGEGGGTYSIVCSASTAEGLEALLGYLDRAGLT